MDINKIPIISAADMTLASIVFIFFERLKPYNPVLKIFRSGYLTDMIWYNLFQNFSLTILISYLIEAIDNSFNISQYRLNWDWPIWLKVSLFLVAHNLYIYFFHKWQHKIKYLWRVQEAHHSPCEVARFSIVRSYAFESITNQTIEFLPIIILGARPELHCWHHTTGKSMNKNIATKLSFCDTLYHPEKLKAQEYGLKNYFTQFINMIRAVKKKQAI